MEEYYGLLSLFLYIIIATLIGLSSVKEPLSSFRRYAIGYHNISSSVLICGILASSIGAGTIIGKVEKFFHLGIAYLIAEMLRPFSWYIASKIFPRRINKFYGCLSISHVMYRLYGKSGRVITTILTILVELVVLSAQMLAIGLILTNLLGISQYHSILLAFSLIVTFSMMGGIRTITQIGVMQFALFFLVLPVSYAFVASKYGGYNSLHHKLPIFTWGINYSADHPFIIISLAIFALIPSCNSSFIQKCLIVRNPYQLEQSLRTVGLLYIPIIIALCFIGYMVDAVAPDIIPNQAMIYYLNNMVPVFLKSALCIGIIAIIMGMSDGILHATSVIIANDIIRVMRPGMQQATLLLYARGSIIVFSSLALFLVSWAQDILGIIWAIQSFWFPIIMLPLCAGFLDIKVKKGSFLIATITTFLCVLIGYWLGLFPIIILGLGVIGNFIGFFGGNLVLKILAGDPDIKLSVERFLLKLKNLFAINHYIRILKTYWASIKLSLYPPFDKMDLWQRNIHSQFCVVVMIYLFVYAVYLHKQDMVMLVLMSTSYCMCSMIMIRNIIFKNFGKSFVFRLMWYISLTFCMPTIAIYSLLQNETNVLLVLNSGLSIITMCFFTNAITFMVCTITGSIISILIHFYFSGADVIHISSTFYYVLGASILTGALLARPHEKIVKREFGRMHVIAGNMAHEVKSPLAANYGYAEIVASLINSRKAKHKGDRVLLEFNQDDYKTLCEFSSLSVEVALQGIKSVDLLLLNMKQELASSKLEKFYVLDVVLDAVKQYVSFYKRAQESILIEVDPEIEMKGVPEYMTNAVYNLVKNAFDHGGNNVRVRIYSEGDQLIIQDDGNGISSDAMPMIFERFYAKASHGRGIGLAFCKMVMESFGGGIVCESSPGNYTKFTLFIP